MISRKEYETAKARGAELIRRSGVAVTEAELAELEVMDFGLGQIERFGLEVLHVLETDAVTVRLAALLPGQTCPEHRHRPHGDYPGKEETFRCAWGELYVYMPGPPTEAPRASLPQGREGAFTVRHETVLTPGQQVTSPPNTLHWFQGGPEGAVVWLFSSPAMDARDVFTDPDVRRMDPVVGAR